LERELLYERVDRRVAAMMDLGLAQEVRRLLQKGYRWGLPPMSGLGYIQFKPHFEGRATLEEVVAEIRRATRRFIRHQYNWFRLRDPAIVWFEVTRSDAGQVEALIERWLAGQHVLSESFASRTG
jgi:tRNA dimethylallyltransferase